MTDEQIKQNAEEYYDKLDSMTIEAEDEQSAYEEAEWNVENMSNREFMKELDIQPNGYDVYAEGEC